MRCVRGVVAVAGVAVAAGAGLLLAPAAGAAPGGGAPPTTVVEGPVPVEPGTVVLVRQICATRPVVPDPGVWTQLTHFAVMSSDVGRTGGLPEWEARGTISADAAPGQHQIFVACGDSTGAIGIETGPPRTGEPGAPIDGAGGAAGGHGAPAAPVPAPGSPPGSVTSAAGPAPSSGPARSAGVPAPSSRPVPVDAPAGIDTPVAAGGPLQAARSGTPVRAEDGRRGSRLIPVLSTAGGIVLLAGLAAFVALRRTGRG
jgi:hypothetical protein